MAENELVPVGSSGGFEARKLKTLLRTEDITAVRLSDVPRDSLVPALQCIMAVMDKVREKYTELKEIAGSIDHVSKYGKSERMGEISKLAKDIEEQEKAIKDKEAQAEAAKSRFPGWVTIVCGILFLCQIWPGIIAYFCFNSHYKKRPTDKGLEEQVKLLKEAESMKWKLEADKTKLEQMKASLEAYIDSQKRSLEDEQNKLALALQNYLQTPEINWALNALSDDYMDIPIIEQLIKYLQGGRADNLKEAINLFEEELHRGRLESLQRATLKTTRATLSATKNIAGNAEYTAQAMDESNAALRDIEALLKKGRKKYVVNLLRF